MKAGRELDALVAEKVMGWTWDGKTAWSPTGSRLWMVRKDPYWWLPYYSTDIAAAWEVVEKLVLLENCQLTRNTKGEWAGENGLYAVTRLCHDPIGSIGELKRVSLGEGETMPHAIALAALKTVGHKLE